MANLIINTTTKAKQPQQPRQDQQPQQRQQIPPHWHPSRENIKWPTSLLAQQQKQKQPQQPRHYQQPQQRQQSPPHWRPSPRPTSMRACSRQPQGCARPCFMIDCY